MVDRSDWACKGDPIECNFEAAAGYYENRYRLAKEMLDRLYEACMGESRGSLWEQVRAAGQFLRLARGEANEPPILLTRRTRYVGQYWFESEERWVDIPDEVKGRTEWVHAHQAKYFRDLLTDAQATLNPGLKPPVTRIVKRAVTEELVIT